MAQSNECPFLLFPTTRGAVAEEITEMAICQDQIADETTPWVHRRRCQRGPATGETCELGACQIYHIRVLVVVSPISGAFADQRGGSIRNAQHNEPSALRDCSCASGVSHRNAEVSARKWGCVQSRFSYCSGQTTVCETMWSDSARC